MPPDLGFDSAPPAEVPGSDAAPVPPAPQARPAASGSDGDDDDDSGRSTVMTDRVKRRLIKRTIATYAEAQSVDPAVVPVVLAAFGHPAAEIDAAGLTNVLLLGERSAAKSLLTQFAQADASALASAIQLVGRLAEDRDVALRWWRVASSLGLVSGAMPRGSQGATGLVSAMSGLSEGQRAVLSSAAEFVAKT